MIYLGKILEVLQESSQEDVDAAVDSASNAFKIWSHVEPAERGRILYNAAQTIKVFIYLTFEHLFYSLSTV